MKILSVEFDERSRLPKLPEGPCPTEEELLALGLPGYSPFPYEGVTEVEEEEIDRESEDGDDIDVEAEVEDEVEDDFAGMEAQLEAEYELFKESLVLDVE